MPDGADSSAGGWLRERRDEPIEELDSPEVVRNLRGHPLPRRFGLLLVGGAKAAPLRLGELACPRRQECAAQDPALLGIQVDGNGHKENDGTTRRTSRNISARLGVDSAVHQPSRRVAAWQLVATLLAACAPVADAPIPVGYEDVVNGARASVAANFEGIFRPGLAFVELRCLANGGHVVVFREVGGSNDGKLAWGMQGATAMPGSRGWSGGFGEDGMLQEIALNFGGIPRVACPPR